MYPSPRQPPITTRKTVLVNLGVALVYAGLGYLTLEVATATGVELRQVLWVPSGLALAVGLLQPLPVWPGVVGGAVVATLLDGSGLPFAAATGVANGLEVALAIWLLDRVGFAADLRSTRGMLYLAICAAGISAAAAAALSTGGLVLTDGVSTEAFGRVWVMWWLTHAMGILMVVPSAIGLVRNRPEEPEALVRMLGILGVVLVATWVPFRAAPDSLVGELFFIPLVLLLLAALRSEMLGAALGTLIVAVGAVVGAVLESGPLVWGTPNETLFLTWSFTSVTTVTVLAAAAVAHDRAYVARERARLERQVLHTQKLEGLGVLAGGVAHDFNNLLMGITGYADLLRDSEQLDAQGRADVESILVTAATASELCGQMLTYAGQSPLSLAPLDLSERAVDIHRLLSVSVPKNVDLRLERGREPVFALADDGQMRQVLLNLATNAAEAVAASDGPGSVTIHVRRAHVDRDWLERALLRDGVEPGEYAVVTVADDGVGLRASEIERIFDPFFSTKGAGRGLGLSATLGVIRSHGGAIVVESEPGVGSTFEVAVPLAEGPGAAAGEGARHEVSSGEYTVLVVDDEPKVREVVSRALKSAGYRTLVARDGDEALEKLESAPEIDLVLLDLTMPRRDGASTLREMRARGLDTPVVVASGYARQAVPEDLSIAAFIHKPFRREELVQVLAGVLAPEDAKPPA